MIRALVSLPFFRRYMSAVLAVALTTSIVVGTGFAAPSGSQGATDTVPVAQGTPGEGSGGGGGNAGPTEATPAPDTAAPDTAAPADQPAVPQTTGRDRQKVRTRDAVKLLRTPKAIAPTAPGVSPTGVTCVVPPHGEIIGKKFKDSNCDGVRQSNEPYLSGWTFRLTNTDSKDPVTLTGVTAYAKGDPKYDASQPDAGWYHFRDLPAGHYSLTEVVQDGWKNTTDLPVNTTLAKDCTTCLSIGNAPNTVHKVFRLTLVSAVNVPADAKYFVRYSIGGAEVDRQLTGGPTSYQFAIDLPWNTVIDWYRVYAKVGSEAIWLGEQKPGEKLCSPTVTNPWCFTPGEICGSKQIDTNHDGKPDAPGCGWTIKLYRLDSAHNPVEVASTTTGNNGSYHFTGLLPGTYHVSEVEDPGYIRILPANENKLGPFEVLCGSSFTHGTTFVNQRKAAALKIEKTADKTCVHVGDKIQYTITVTNIGDVDLTNVKVTDTKLGLNYTVPTLAKGASATVPLEKTTYVAKYSDGTKVHNVASATAMSPFGCVGPVTACADVCILHPAICLVKTVDPTSVTLTETDPKAPVTYKYVITNTGDATLFNVTLTDDKLGTILGVNGLKGPAITLTPHESATVIVADVLIDKPTHNVGTTTGEDQCDKTVTDTDDACVSVCVVKTFKLTLGADVDKADGYFVRYTIGSATKNEPLVAQGGGVYTATVKVPYGTKINSWQFFATPGPTALAPAEGPETLTCPKTNPLRFKPGEISGHKFVGSLENNTPKSGWTVYLYRNGGTEPYMTALTDGNGEYHFTGLLPGSYTVSELEDPNYTRIKPAGENIYGPFSVVCGSVFSGKDFVNQKKTAALKIEKTANKTCVHVGDEIQYTITVTNIGDLDLTDVRVTDAKLGVDYTFPTLAKGASANVPANLTTYTATADDGKHIHNVAIATGMSAFGSVGPVQDDADVCVLHPSITLVKSVVPTIVTVTEANPAAPVTYTYLVTNTGDTTLFNVTLTDDQLGTILGVGGSNGPAITLAAGESTTVVVANVPISKPTHNIATVEGFDKCDKKVSATDDADVAVNVIKTFELTLTSDVANADSYFVRYVIGESSIDLPLVAVGGGKFSATVTVPYGTTIASWQYFAVSGSNSVALAPAGGPETLQAAKTNPLTFKPGEISGHKFVGSLENNTPKSGWTVYLYRNGGIEPYMTALTDSNGEYHFTGLLPGSYTVSELEDPNYTRIKPAGENVYGPFLVPSESAFTDNDFVNELKTENISGHKFNDLDADGTWDEGEPGIEDWTIKLQIQEEGGWIDFATTTTGEDGSYTFTDVPANATYRVVEVPQEGWTQSMPANGGFYTVEPTPGAEPRPVRLRQLDEWRGLRLQVRGHQRERPVGQGGRGPGAGSVRLDDRAS